MHAFMCVILLVLIMLGANFIAHNRKKLMPLHIDVPNRTLGSFKVEKMGLNYRCFIYYVKDKVGGKESCCELHVFGYCWKSFDLSTQVQFIFSLFGNLIYCLRKFNSNEKH